MSIDKNLSTLSKFTQTAIGYRLYRGDGLMSHPGEANDTCLLNTSEIIDKHLPFEPIQKERVNLI